MRRQRPRSAVSTPSTVARFRNMNQPKIANSSSSSTPPLRRQLKPFPLARSSIERIKPNYSPFTWRSQSMIWKVWRIGTRSAARDSRFAPKISRIWIIVSPPPSNTCCSPPIGHYWGIIRTNRLAKRFTTFARDSGSLVSCAISLSSQVRRCVCQFRIDMANCRRSWRRGDIRKSSFKCSLMRTPFSDMLCTYPRQLNLVSLSHFCFFV